MTTRNPFPDPEVPDVDASGIRVPPWIKYPNLPYGSLGWRMGAGEYYWDCYRNWYVAQLADDRRMARKAYPEPGDWSGFFSNLWSGYHSNLGIIKINTDRYMAGIWGALVGDALGVPFEFKAPEHLPAANEIDMVMPAGFTKSHSAIPYGTWSDDGAQLLCLLEILLQSEDFDAARFGDSLIKWSHEAYHQSGGVVFDRGGQATQAIRRLEDGVAPLDAGGVGERSNGNGSLMRSLPVAIFGHLQGWSRHDIVDLAHMQSRVTHAHPVSQVCCALYCLIAHTLLDDPFRPMMDCYRRVLAELMDVYRQNALSEHTKALVLIDAYPKNNFRRGSGYVVDTLWTSVDSLEKSDSYVSAVRAAIDYGNDTDTTACVTGGLAGIRYGVEGELGKPGGIPAAWISQLAMPEESIHLLNLFRERLNS